MSGTQHPCIYLMLCAVIPDIRSVTTRLKPDEPLEGRKLAAESENGALPKA